MQVPVGRAPGADEPEEGPAVWLLPHLALPSPGFIPLRFIWATQQPAG